MGVGRGRARKKREFHAQLTDFTSGEADLQLLRDSKSDGTLLAQLATSPRKIKTKNLGMGTSMKTWSRRSLALPALITGFCSLLAGQMTAQTFTNLHSFVGSDGANPNAGLLLSGNVLYGTTANGGNGGSGTVFALNADGTSFTILHDFTPGSGLYYPLTNSDGAYPSAPLVLSHNTLYGTTKCGGTSGLGTVFAVNTDGTGFTNLHTFNTDGARPNGLVLSGNTLYGTTQYGTSNAGTVFALNTDGSGFSTLHNFGGYGGEGGEPQAGLILSGHILYGTTSQRTITDWGALFALNTNGTGYTSLYDFDFANGASPQAPLSQSGNTLYGTTYSGGTSTNGILFAQNIDGTVFANLHTFSAMVYGRGTNSDGAHSRSGLILSGGRLYGTASQGGSGGNGTLFAVYTDGTGFTTLHTFAAFPPYPGPQTNSDGADPGGLVLSGNALYGTTASGGSSGSGTVFSMSIIGPPLAIARYGANLLLGWVTNATGFTLQSSTNLGSSAIWTTVSPGPALLGGNNVVIAPMSGTQQFFRLSQ